MSYQDDQIQFAKERVKQIRKAAKDLAKELAEIEGFPLSEANADNVFEWAYGKLAGELAGEHVIRTVMYCANCQKRFTVVEDKPSTPGT